MGFSTQKMTQVGPDGLSDRDSSVDQPEEEDKVELIICTWRPLGERCVVTSLAELRGLESL